MCTVYERSQGLGEAAMAAIGGYGNYQTWEVLRTIKTNFGSSGLAKHDANRLCAYGSGKREESVEEAELPVITY
jgi:hypothetical protein